MENTIGELFTILLNDISISWPAEDISYVTEEVCHHEYGGALEELVAIGLQNGKGFERSEVVQIEVLARAMHLEMSPWIEQLRQMAEPKRSDS